MNIFGKRQGPEEPDHRFILALADLHVFHGFGLTPWWWETSAGNRLVLSKAQQYLRECWEHLMEILPPAIDVLFLVGDITEGQNVFENARMLSEVDPVFQAVGAAELLAHPIAKMAKERRDRNIYMTRGSTYHTGIGKSLEETTAQLIGAKPKGRHRCHPWRVVDVDGVLFDVAHHQSFTIRYSSMPLERELEFLYTRKAKRREVLPQEIVILRAHTHKGFRVWREGGAVCVSLPAFKLQDFYAAGSRTPNRLVPDNLGAVGIKIFKEPVDGTRVRVVPYLYDHPADEVEVARFD